MLTLAIYTRKTDLTNGTKHNTILSVKPGSDKGNQMARVELCPLDDRSCRGNSVTPEDKAPVAPGALSHLPSPTGTLLGHELMVSAAGQKLTIPPAARLKRIAWNPARLGSQRLRQLRRKIRRRSHLLAITGVEEKPLAGEDPQQAGRAGWAASTHRRGQAVTAVTVPSEPGGQISGSWRCSSCLVQISMSLLATSDTTSDPHPNSTLTHPYRWESKSQTIAAIAEKLKILLTGNIQCTQASRTTTIIYANTQLVTVCCYHHPNLQDSVVMINWNH